MIEKDTPVIALAHPANRKQLISNALEVKARGAFVIGIDTQKSEAYDFWFEVPDLGLALPLLSIVPVQVLAYYLAVEKGLDPDKPRNLAKCVTVL